MADTKRLTVIKLIQAKLKEIVTPTYECNVGSNVFLGRLTFGEETDVPFISLWEPFSEDGPDIRDKAGRVQRAGRAQKPQDVFFVRYYIQGFAEENRTDPTINAYHLLGCIQKCLGPLVGESNPFGAASIDLGHGLVRPSGTMNAEKPYCLVTLDIKLTEERGNPYD